MKKLYFLLLSIFLFFLFFSIIINQFQEVFNKSTPPAIETIIVDGEDEEKYDKKQEWIEEMHRHAPEDNWRLMDQKYRIDHQNSKQVKDDLPVYGKWKEVGSNNQAGRTVFTHFDLDSQTIYTAADGGQIWKKDLSDDTWEVINDHLRIPAIRFLTKLSVENEDRLLVHSAQYNTIGIYLSDDGGFTWSLAVGLDGPAGWGFIKRTVVTGGDNPVIYCITQEWDYNAWHAITGVYRSDDFGTSFEMLDSFDFGVNTVDIWTSTINEGPVYLMANNELFMLNEEDQLENISSLPSIETGKTILAGFDSGSGNYLYAMVRIDNTSFFYASELDGEEWDETGTHNQGPFMINSFAASVYEQDVLYYGGIEAFTSYNGGVTWELVNGWGQYYSSPEDKLHADIPSYNSFIQDTGEEILFVNTDGGTYISYDHMENVSNISLEDLRISQYYSSYTCRFDPDVTHTGSQDQGYQRSMDGTNPSVINYDQLISGDYASMVSGDDGASIWMVYPGFAMYGPNINNTNALVLANFVGSNYQWLPKLMDDPDDPENVYMAGGRITDGTHIIKLERNGNSVSYSEEPYDFSNGTDAKISAFDYSKIDHNYRYVLTTERDFFYSTDAGVNWTQTEAFEGPDAHFFYGAGIALGNADLGTVYVGGSGYSNPGVYQSLDNGETFTAFDEGLPETMVFDLVLTMDDSLLFAATTVGAFVCKTWEGQWYSLFDSLVPDQEFWDVDLVDTLDLVRFATYGRGVWDFLLDPDVEADFTADQTFITTNETVNFTDLTSFNPISWEWLFPGGIPASSNEQHPDGIAYPEQGSYHVQLIVSNDQSTDTLLKEDYITVGIVGVSDTPGNDQINIFPNPASDYIYIDSKGAVSEIRIYTNAGILARTIRINPGENIPSRIDISKLNKGIYYLVIGNMKVAKKLIVK